MEKVSILTPAQKLIFNKISKSDFLRSNFYFTGGTALSEFYLKHRYSEDLDFFSEKKFDFDTVASEISIWAKETGFTFKSQLKEVVFIFFLKFRDKSSLKLDFGYYPHKRIKKGLKFKSFSVDSLTDIAVNKFVAIHQRSAAKDLTDLYFLLKKFTIWDLINGAKIKFNMETDPFILSSDLAYAAENLDILPKMIKPLKLPEMKKFFRELAVKLGRSAVK